MPDDSIYAPFSIARREDGTFVELGRGAMGITYQATDTQLGRTVALKVINATYLGDPIARQRFLAEARAAAKLQHTNVASIYHLRAEGNEIFYAMEFVEGETVEAYVRRRGPLPTRLALRIALQAAQGLAAANERGLIHRDIKPANLMLAHAPSPAGEGIEHEEEDGLLVKVIDFGLAKSVGGNESGAGLTGGNVVGTPYYMSPEQISIEIGSTLDCRSDIYSLGMTIWYLLTGRTPFGGTQFEILSQHLQKRPPLEELSDAGISAEVVSLIGSMLAKDRDERPANHPALIAALKKLLRTGGSTTSASGPEDSSRVESPDGTLAMPAVSTEKGTSSTQQVTAAIRADEEFSIAVLPFKASGGAKMEAFANGLGQDITTGLSRFRYLSVVAKPSTARPKGHDGDDRAVGAELGARYILDGSIRQSGSTIRVSAQLIDAHNGAQLWAETYDRDPKTSGIFAVQDDIATRIVATVADSYGVLVHAMASVLRQKDDADLPPVAWQFQYFAYREQITPSSHAELKSRLERVVERDNRQSDLWACLAQIHTDEFAFGFGDDATSLDQALAAGRRAVELDRANQFALVSLSQVHFFRRDLAGFRPAAERAMALNPLNTDALGILGLLMVHTGEFERGTAIVRRAMELNANHAGWMHFAPLWDHFHKGEYEQALERANRVDVPGLFWPYLVMASACGHLGRHAEAAAAVRDLLALDPEFAAHARSNVGTWHFASGLMDPILEGLRKAGLSIPETDGSPMSGEPTATIGGKTERAPTASGPIRADEGFWVAVLPFKYGGTDASLTALADGLTEEIVTGLSRFSYLRVMSRSSTDSRYGGKQLGARYVMEGSLRQAGTKLRFAVQLVDAISGAHLWAENFERTFSPETVFELQDDLVPRIVSTVADMHGVLPRSMSEVVRLKAADQMSPYEALLRSFGYNERFTPEDLAEVRTCLERAVQQAPGNAECWAMLSVMYANEYGHWDNAGPESLDRSLRAARTAVEAAPLHSLPYYALAQALFFKREIPAFRVAAERAVSLNPMDGATAAFMGLLIAYAGDWESGCALSEKGSQLNPNHPGWYRYTAWHDAYRKKDYRTALDVALRLNAPQNYYTHAVLAMCHAQLGQMEEARKAVADMLALKPNYAEVARELHGRWIEPDLVEQLMDGLRKAGLEIPPESGTAGLPPDRARSSATESGAARGEDGSTVLPALPVPKLAAASPPRTSLAWWKMVLPVGALVLALTLSWWRPWRATPGAAVDGNIKSVAVLPFVNLSADKNDEYLSDGMTEELLNVLAKVKGLRVPGRTSSFAFKGRTEDGIFRKVGEELQVKTVLEGSVRKAGDKLRITAQLINVADGYHLWSETYDADMKDILAVQSDVAQRVVRALQVQLGMEEAQALAKTPTQNPEAYRLYLLGRYQFAKFTREGWAAAIRYFEQALQIDPTFVLAYCGLADTYGWCGGQIMPGREAWAKEKELALKALALDPKRAEAHLSLATALFSSRDYAGSVQSLDRALALDPNLALAYDQYGWTLLGMGRPDDAVTKERKALELDPLNPLLNTDLGLFLQMARRYDEAIVELRKTLEMDNNNALAHLELAWSLHWKGKTAEALAEFKKAASLDDLAWYVGCLGYAYGASGDRANADQMLRDLDEMAKTRYVSPAARASVYLGLGEKPKALDWLEQAFADEDPILWWQGSDQLYDNVRTDPRYQALLGKDETWRKSSGPSTTSPANATRSAATTAPIDAKSVAVLAFENLSDDKSNEYFSDGVSEELLNLLANVPGLKVSARTSAFSFKGRPVAVAEIARQLGVAYVVEGSVRKAGNRVRITAQLINAADGFHVWSDTFDRELKDIFALQDEIAGLIAGNLRLKLDVAASPRAVNSEAYRLYLEGRQAWNRRTLEGIQQAETLLNRAIELEPNFARAHAALADVWSIRRGMISPGTQVFVLRDSPENNRIIAKARQAVSLDPNSAEAHAALGNALMQTWRMEEAEGELRRAVALNPNYASAHQWLGRLLNTRGRVDESLAALQKAADLDPLSHRILDNLADQLAQVGRVDEAWKVIERARALNPDIPQIQIKRAELLARLGRREEALAEARRLVEASWSTDYGSFAQLTAIQIFTIFGLKQEAEALLPKIPDGDGERALALAQLGRPREALPLLDKIFFSWLDFVLYDPSFDPVRNDPVFQAWIAKVGLKEAHELAQAWSAAHPAYRQNKSR